MKTKSIKMLRGICGVMLAVGLSQAFTARATLTSTADRNWSLASIAIPGIENGVFQASTLPKAEVISQGLAASAQSSFGTGSLGGVATPMSVAPEPGTALVGALLLLPLAAAWRKMRA